MISIFLIEIKLTIWYYSGSYKEDINMKASQINHKSKSIMLSLTFITLVVAVGVTIVS